MEDRNLTIPTFTFTFAYTILVDIDIRRRPGKGGENVNGSGVHSRRAVPKPSGRRGTTALCYGQG